MRATILRAMLSCLLSGWMGISCASVDWLAPNHPASYQVKEGDTVWEIAERFLKEPWRWTQVWQGEKGNNPDRIFPGDTIVLSMNGDEPELHVNRSQTPRAQPVTIYEEKHEEIAEIRPRVRYLPSTKAIPTIPYSVIGPFLSRSQVMPEGVLEYATAIVAVDEDRLLVSEGNRFFTPLISSPMGSQISLFRRGSLLTHPDTQEILGEVAFYLGTAEVESHSTTTSLIVQKSQEEIRPGDRLCPVEEEIIEPYFFPKMPQGFAYGYILSVFGGINQIGPNQVVVISGGYDAMREVGDVLAIYQTKEDVPTRLKRKENFYAFLCGETTDLQFTPILVGRLIVFKIFDKTSLGLIVSATRPIYLQDVVMSP